MTDVLFGWFSASPALVNVVAAAPRSCLLINLPAGPGTDYVGNLAAQGPTPLRAMARAKLGANPDRIGLVGFSHGCQGIRAALATGDGGAIDGIVAVDGIHTDWVSQKSQQFNANLLAPFVAYGNQAAQGRGLLAITTSAIQPPTFVSTTLDSNFIWQQVTGQAEDSYQDMPPPEVWSDPVNPPFEGKAEIPWVRYRQKGGLAIFNASGGGASDHRLQGLVVLPRVVEALLLARWAQKGGAC